MLRGPFRQVHYAIMLAKTGGLKIFACQLKRQIYSTTTLIGLKKDLEANSVQVPCRSEYTLRPASDEDMLEVLRKSKSESKQSAHELLQRKWFYESGFRNCYVARTADTGELCYIQWLVSPEDNHVVKRGFRSRLPRLTEDECLLENAFTFERYRGNRIMSSAVAQLCEIARKRGFKQMIAYVSRYNVASLKACEEAGFKKFENVPELKLLFFTRRKHG